MTPDPPPDIGVPAAWLASRLAASPPDLARAIEEQIASRTPDGELTSFGLASRGIDIFERVSRSSQTRAAALALLAADALITYAFESAADPEIGGSAVAATALAAQVGPRGELGRRAARSPRAEEEAET
jgi:hypothetical protein